MRPRARLGLGLAAVSALVAHALAALVIGSGVGGNHRFATGPAALAERPNTMVARIVSVAAMPSRPPAVLAVENGSAVEHPSRVAPRRPAPVKVTTAAIESRPGRPKASEVVAMLPRGPVGGAEPMIASPSPYWPTNELEFPPLPRSAPDATRLLGVVASGLPIRLRLYIDALGVVAAIDVLQAADQDADVVERMKNMFYDTRFLAGRRAGIDVDSYMDIEVSAADLM